MNIFSFRYLLDRLVRKFGYEVVKGLVDKEDETTLKRLKNIKKQQMRKKNLDEENEAEDSNQDDADDFSIKSKSNTMEDIIGDFDDEEGEFDSNEKRKSKKTGKSGAGKTYIADEGIVDFLDASAAQKLRTSMPSQASQKLAARKKKSDFEIAPDGRLLIQDSEDSEQDEEMHSVRISQFFLRFDFL